MRLIRTAAAAALLCSSALEAKEAWRTGKTTIELSAASVTLPRTAGATTLVKTGEFSKAGQGVDNHAQYESADGKVFATAYIYRAAYADAALAAYATDWAVRGRFGDAVKVTEQGVVAASGQADGAIRAVYDGAVLNGAATSTAAAFIRVDGWIVKLRASGPAERRAEVVTALDALISGLSVGRNTRVYPAKALSLTQQCPAPKTEPARPLGGQEAQAQMLLGGLLGGAAILGKDKSRTAAAAFPANGMTPVCVRGQVRLGERALDVLQPAGDSDPGIILMPFSDSGGVMAVEGSPFGKGYTVKVYGIAEVTIGGTLDRLPPNDQVESWFKQPDGSPLVGRSRTTFAADGKITTEVNTSALK